MKNTNEIIQKRISNNTYEIIKFHDTFGDKFFTVAITNEEGEMHTDVFSAALLIQFAIKMKGNFNVADDEELQHELSELAFIEIAEETDGETEKEIFDIYIHKFEVDDAVLRYDQGGDFIKTYKTEKAAKNFAAKQGHPVL